MTVRLKLPKLVAEKDPKEVTYTVLIERDIVVTTYRIIADNKYIFAIVHFFPEFISKNDC